MKKSIETIFLIMILSLTGCAKEATIEERDYSKLEKDLGKQITQVGYRSVQKDIYESADINEIEDQIPSQREITYYDYEGNRIELKSYRKENESLTLLKDEKYEYTDSAVTKVYMYDENGNELLISKRQEDGNWIDYDSNDNELESSYVRDQYGNQIEEISDSVKQISTYDVNGYVLEVKEEDLEGSVQVDTTYQRNTNGHLADLITTKGADTTQSYSLLRGDLVNDSVTNYYYDSDNNKVDTHIDSYDANGLIVTCQDKKSDEEKSTVIIYIYNE